MVPLNLERELGDLDKTQMPDQWVWGGWGGVRNSVRLTNSDVTLVLLAQEARSD